jgi:ribosomal protein S18 acetylase RimI-like enzyme
MEQFVIEIANESDWESIGKLRSDFKSREFLTQKTGETRNWADEPPLIFKEWIADGHSLVVKDTSTDRIVGYSLNPVAQRQDSSQTPSCDPVMNFLEHLEVDCDIFTQFNLERGIELCILNVHKDFCHRGLGRKLVEQTIEHSRQQAFQFIKTSCTSPWMLHVFQEFGFQVLKQLKLIDHLVNGKAAFPLAAPGDFASFLVKVL